MGGAGQRQHARHIEVGDREVIAEQPHSAVQRAFEDGQGLGRDQRRSLAGGLQPVRQSRITLHPGLEMALRPQAPAPDLGFVLNAAGIKRRSRLGAVLFGEIEGDGHGFGQDEAIIDNGRNGSGRIEVEEVPGLEGRIVPGQRNMLVVEPKFSRDPKGA
jgi:hypothetical protein